jgi:thiol-disulfide isomerase/thioredoxin
MIQSISSLQHFIQQDLVIVLAKSKSCTVCVAIDQQMKRFLKDFPTISYETLYIEEVPEFSGQHLVFTVPTVLIFYQQKEILRESRFIQFQKIHRLLINLN